METRRQYSNNLLGELSVRKHRMPKDGGIKAIATLEVFVTKNGHGGQGRRRLGSRLRSAGGRGWLWYAIRLREIATERDLSFHQAKEVRGDHRGADLLRRSVLPLQDVSGRND